MKNLSGKPYFEGNPERKTFTLAVVRAVFGQSQCPFYNLITKTQNCSASGRGTRLSQGVCSFHSLLSHRFMQSSLSSPFLLGARHFQVLRGRCTVPGRLWWASVWGVLCTLRFRSGLVMGDMN